MQMRLGWEGGVVRGGGQGEEKQRVKGEKNTAEKLITSCQSGLRKGTRKQCHCRVCVCAFIGVCVFVCFNS